MRRSQVVAALVVAVLAVAVGTALARRHDGKPAASPTPSPTTQSASPTATGPTTTETPTPKGSGPRDREYDVVYAAGATHDEAARAIADAGGEIVSENTAVNVAAVLAGRDFLQRARAAGTKAIYAAVANPANGLAPATDNPKPLLDGTGPKRTDPGGNGEDPLADLQWDMDAIHVHDAHTTEAGDPRVLVAVIDTGVDKTHPDLAKAYDTKLSRNFVTDAPGADGPCETPTCHDPVGVDESGHGTHVAGTMVAAQDGFGIAGVAPGVRLVDLRAGQDSGLFLLKSTVDALTYAGDIGVDVANLSYFVDPWLYNCPDSPDDSALDRYQQQAILEGATRAVEYAHRKGVTLVGAAGNEHKDLANPRVDTISPDFPDKQTKVRRLTTNCRVVPTELPHVIQVSALARDGIKADYSDYGLNHITVTAPGGSAMLAHSSSASTTNQTLSAYPEDLARDEGLIGPDGESRTPALVEYCRASTCAYYRWFAGTSMASPHAAGVAALIVSRYGHADPAHAGALTLAPDEVARRLRDTAVAKPCPSPPTVHYARKTTAFDATCRGSTARNGFYGDGLVDARAAVR